jgi:class 3 adenylate cyclase
VLVCATAVGVSETRKLAAILVTDVVGSGRLAGAEEERTFARSRGLRSDLIDPANPAPHGRIVKRTGDGVLIEFRRVVDAVRCVIEVRTGLIERKAGMPPDRRIEFGVGTYLGDVIEDAGGWQRMLPLETRANLAPSRENECSNKFAPKPALARAAIFQPQTAYARAGAHSLPPRADPHGRG